MLFNLLLVLCATVAGWCTHAAELTHPAVLPDKDYNHQELGQPPSEPAVMPAAIPPIHPRSFMIYPTGAEPEIVARKLAEDLIARRLTEPNKNITYFEACTAQGALEFSGLIHDLELQKKLVGLYDSNLANLVQSHMKGGIGVDNHAFGIIPFEMFLQTRNPAYRDLASTLVADEWKEPLLPNGLTPMSRYWIDDTYMVGMLLVQSYRATHNPADLQRLGLFMSLYLEKLQRPNGLFFHGEKFPFFWGRGNGWGAVSLANALTVLPATDPRQSLILSGYHKMMAALLSYQESNGMWHQLVDHPESYEETSATAMFTYAFIVGVKCGWIDRSAYEPAAQKGWLALVRHLDPNGRLTDICIGTGQKDDINFYLTRPRETGNFHGHGPMLWCANALLR